MLLFSTKKKKQQQQQQKKKQTEKHLNSLKAGLKIHKGNTKYMTNHADSEDILTDQEKNEEVTEYLGQATYLKDTTKEEIYARSEQRGAVFDKTRKYSKIDNFPFHSFKKKKVMYKCVLPTMNYGCQTWSLNKQLTNKLRTAQR